MDCQEFLCALKGSGSALLAEVAALRERHNLDKLYLIYITENEAVWGLRIAKVLDQTTLRTDLLNLMGFHIGTNYNSENKNLFLFASGADEVHYVVNKELVPFIESEGGELKIISINEESGEIVVSLKGACATCPHSLTTMQQGLKKTLTALLPWVKTVKSADKPDEENDPWDYGGEG